MSEPLREALAAYAHDAWSGWMNYQLSKGYVGADGMFRLDMDKYERWKRQKNTPYAELPESEKESDRKEADVIISLVAAWNKRDDGLARELAESLRTALNCLDNGAAPTSEEMDQMAAALERASEAGLLEGSDVIQSPHRGS